MQNSVLPVYIGDVPIGDNFPTVLMAEIGTFFNQDIQTALSYVEKIHKAGAQILKTELLHNPDVCLPKTGLMHEYQYAHGKTKEDYRSLIERKVLPLEEYLKLFKLAHRLKIPIVCSVYDKEGIDFLLKEGGAAVKFSRDNINNLPLIRYAAETKLPIIFDAGNTYLHEIARAKETAQRSGASGVIVNLHPAANPAPPELHNLRTITTYKKSFGVPVGLACHYRGNEILYAAVGAGVNIIEKGIVDDPDRKEQDLVSAARLSEVNNIVETIKNCWLALGSDIPQVREPRDYSSWKGMVAKTDIKPGDTLTLENVQFSFPPLGISVEHWDITENKKTLKALKKNQVISWDMIQI